MNKINITSSVHAGFEVLTAVVLKNSVFWDVTSCGVGGKQSCSRNQRESRWQAELLKKLA
jgi:hypothetical protein